MLYYKLKAYVKDAGAIPASERDEYACWTEEIKDKTISYNEQYLGAPFSSNQFFLYTTNKDYLRICGVFGYRCRITVEDAATAFVKALGFEVDKLEGPEEIKISELASYAHMADRQSFIPDDDEFLVRCAIGTYNVCRNSTFEEYFAKENYSLEEAKKVAKKASFSSSLVAELDRIYTPQKQTSFIGNPAHYIIYCDDEDTSKTITEVLISSLYANGRLKSKRILSQNITRLNNYFTLCDDDDEIVNMKNYFHFQKGGALVIKTGNITDTNFAKRSDVQFEELARLIDMYKVETLSIIILNKGAKTLGQNLKNLLAHVRFVELEEENFYADTVAELLREKAAADRIDDTASLLATIPQGNRAFCAKDVNELYNTWLNTRLANEVYPQYKDIKCGDISLIKPKGDAYSELQSLIGLKSAKTIIQQALDFHKAQLLYRRAGLNELAPSRHMVFTGNPGTAKTTVARLFARILKDNNVLSHGDLIEVGRKDLVGKYVGWTAKLVEDAFNKAQGSVLFIDEAYSLCEERGGLYGDEAINTIVQMMENQRSNTVVIFAGYPDKMQEFLDKNPGLRSRIAFNVNFDNYSTDELVEILQLFASQNGSTLATGVVEKVRPIFEMAQKDPTFGNGRFVRNVFEQAKMRQASRLVRMSSDALTDQTIRTLLPEDFGEQSTLVLQEIRPLGFAC